jgi:hypothetical protein
MLHAIHVRDISRGGRYDLAPDEPMMRVPYDLAGGGAAAFQAVGPVFQHGAMVDWVEGGIVRSARVAAGLLRDAHPGERLLVLLPPGGSSDEWWLCDVEAVDGVGAAH